MECSYAGGERFVNDNAVIVHFAAITSFGYSSVLTIAWHPMVSFPSNSYSAEEYCPAKLANTVLSSGQLALSCLPPNHNAHAWAISRILWPFLTSFNSSSCKREFCEYSTEKKD